MTSYDKIWDSVLEIIKENTTPISFETWFKPLKIRKIDNSLNIVYIEVNSDKGKEFIISTIKNRYMTYLQNAFKTVLNDEYRVVLKDSDEYDKEEAKDSPVIYIQHIKVFIHRRKHLHILAHIKVVVVLLSKSHHRHHAAKYHREQSIAFHHFLLSNINNPFSPPIPYYIYKETTNNIVTHTTNKDSKCKIKENIRYNNSFSSFYRKYTFHTLIKAHFYPKKAQKPYKNKLF